MKRTAILCVLVLGLVGLFAAVPAFADSTVLYTTLGPGGSYSPNNLAGIGWTSGSVIGGSFTLSTGATVGDAELALGYDTSGALGNSAANVYIESDNGGEPGVIIASLTQVGMVPPLIKSTAGGLVTFDCSGAVCTLGAGSYWLVAVQPDTNTLDVWYAAYGDPRGNRAYGSYSSATGPWGVENDPITAFEIDEATVTPELSSFLLLGSGLAGLAGLIKRKLMA